MAGYRMDKSLAKLVELGVSPELLLRDARTRRGVTLRWSEKAPTELEAGNRASQSFVIAAVERAQAQAKREAERAAGGPAATEAQVEFILDLVAQVRGAGRSLPAGPVEKAEIAQLRKVPASDYIEVLKATLRAPVKKAAPEYAPGTAGYLLAELRKLTPEQLALEVHDPSGYIVTEAYIQDMGPDLPPYVQL